MILPSDDEGRPPRSGDGKHGQPEPEDTSFQDAISWGAADDSEEDDEDLPDLPIFLDDDPDEYSDDTDPSMLHHIHQLGEMGDPAMPGWREELKEELVRAVDKLIHIEDPDADYDPPDPPDMAMLLAGFCALRNDIDKRASIPDLELGNALISLVGVLRGEPSLDDVRAATLRILQTLEFVPFPDAGEFYDPESMVIDGYAAPSGPGDVPDTVARVVEPGYTMMGDTIRSARVILFRPF